MSIRHLILSVTFLIIGMICYSQDKTYKTEIWYGNPQVFGNAGFNQPMINIIGRVSHPEDIHTLSWNFQRSRKPLPMGPTAFRLTEPGEFNIEIDRTILEPGEYTLTIIAHYKNGTINRDPLKFSLKKNTAKLPIKIDWAEAENIQDFAQVVDGRWSITESGLRNEGMGYDRAVVLGDATWQDYDLTAEFIIHRFSDDPNTYVWPSVHSALHVAVRWQGHEDWGDIYPRRGWSAFGALFSYDFSKDEQNKMIWIYDQVEKKSLKTSTPYTIETGTPYCLRAMVSSRPGKTSVYKMKLWKKGDTEPAEWELETEGLAGEFKNGSVLLVSHNADISFRSIHVNEPSKPE